MKKETERKEKPRGERRRKRVHEREHVPPIAYPPPTSGPPHYPPPGYPPPGYCPSYYQMPKNHPLAVTAMVLGIISLIGIAICAVLGVALGIVAIVMGIKAKADIEMDPYRYTGMGFAKAGIITGIIGIVISALYIIVIVLFYALFFFLMGV